MRPFDLIVLWSFGGQGQGNFSRPRLTAAPPAASGCCPGSSRTGRSARARGSAARTTRWTQTPDGGESAVRTGGGQGRQWSFYGASVTPMVTQGRGTPVLPAGIVPSAATHIPGTGRKWATPPSGLRPTDRTWIQITAVLQLRKPESNSHKKKKNDPSLATSTPHLSANLWPKEIQSFSISTWRQGEKDRKRLAGLLIYVFPDWCWTAKADTMKPLTVR